ncbi:MAG: hypothetical protein NVSMB47_05290 [Polyangiales bacterium]
MTRNGNVRNPPVAGSVGRLKRALGGALGGAPLFALAMAAASTGVAHAETMAAKFIRIDPEPTATEKTNTPVINFLVEVGVPIPITAFEEGCYAGGKGDKVSSANLACVSAKIEKEGYERQFEFPKDNAIITAEVDGDESPMEIQSADALKDASAANAGVAWLILLDASSSVDVSRWAEEQDAAEQIIKAMGQADAVMVRIMDDKAVRVHTKWLPASSKKGAIDAIRSVPAAFPTTTKVDALISRLEKEAIGSFQELFKSGVEGVEDTTPLMQAIVILSDGGDTSGAGFAGGEQAKVVHEKLTKGDLGISELVKLPMPVVSLWFPDPKLTGGLGNFDEIKSNNAYQWMSNIATPEVGGYFDILQKGEGGKGQKVAKIVRTRFDNMYFIQAKATCLNTNGEQTFAMGFQDTKSKIVPDKVSHVGIDPSQYFGKWILAVDKKKTQAASEQHPLQTGETFEVYGDFCWGSNTNQAEAYFVTEADAPDVKKAVADKTGAKGKSLLQALSAKGQRAETVSVTPTIARFKVPNTPALFDNKGDAFNLNLVVFDNKQKRVSTLDQKGVMQMRARSAPVNKLLIVGAIGGGVVLILLIAILARSGGGNGRAKKRRGGGPPAPGPMPGQPPGPPLAFQGQPLQGGAGAAPLRASPAAGVPVMQRPPVAQMPPLPPMAPLASATAPAQQTAMAPIAQTALAPMQATAPAPMQPMQPMQQTALAPAPMQQTAPQPPQPQPPQPQPPMAIAPTAMPAPRADFAPQGPKATSLPPKLVPAQKPPSMPPPMPPPAQGPAHLPSALESAGTQMAPNLSPAAPAPGLHAQHKGATSYPTTCPNPACRRAVMIPPGGTAQCAFCGTLVDAHGAAIAPIPAGGFALTGHVSPEAADRAVQAGAKGQTGGGTVALAAQTAPMPAAVALVGAGGTYRVLSNIETRVGRDGTQCSIALAEPRISGVHATLKLDGAVLLVRDDRSNNGTFVNGNRIPPGTWTPVPIGSQLRFGPAEFVVHADR